MGVPVPLQLPVYVAMLVRVWKFAVDILHHPSAEHPEQPEAAGCSPPACLANRRRPADGEPEDAPAPRRRRRVEPSSPSLPAAGVFHVPATMASLPSGGPCRRPGKRRHGFILEPPEMMAQWPVKARRVIVHLEPAAVFASASAVLPRPVAAVLAGRSCLRCEAFSRMDGWPSLMPGPMLAVGAKPWSMTTKGKQWSKWCRHSPRSASRPTLSTYGRARPPQENRPTGAAHSPMTSWS